MPVRTSPVPPLAMPGFPVGLRKVGPAGALITDSAPFSTTWAP